MYFAAEQVSVAFDRLSSKRGADGRRTKAYQERTSVLMCFLAFDAICKRSDLNQLDMDPEKLIGKSHRDSVAVEFARLVLLDSKVGRFTQVLELGKISAGGTDPAKRLSSNFLTVPLKKATEQSGVSVYPKRPASTPMIKLGQAATGLKWGMGYHEDWPTSLPRLLSEAKGSTPFTDLAIFVMRDTKLTGSNYVDALGNSINKRYSEALSAFWVDKIKKEKIFARHILENAMTDMHASFARSMLPGQIDSLYSKTREELLEYVLHLETILQANKIQIDQIKGGGKL